MLSGSVVAAAAADVKEGNKKKIKSEIILSETESESLN